LVVIIASWWTRGSNPLGDAVDIAEWLEGLGLGKYASAFAENAIRWDVLLKLTAEDPTSGTGRDFRRFKAGTAQCYRPEKCCVWRLRQCVK
jgi:hypothetical protein